MATYDVTGSGEPLLLLHGALISRAMWRPQVEAFQRSYQVTACDLPAHGESPDVVGEYTIVKLCQHVVDLLDSLGVRQTHVCGHSLGGMVAQQLVVAHPQRIRKLVLAETALGTQNTLWERIQTAFARAFLRLAPQKALVRLSVRQYGSLNDHVGNFIEQEMGQYDHNTSIRVMGAAFGFSAKEHLVNIRAPTLVLVAENNRRTHAQGRVLANRIPNASFEVIPDSHHLLNLDSSEAFNRAVMAFLDVDAKPSRLTNRQTV